jgi:predicted nucleotidyltransferase
MIKYKRIEHDIYPLLSKLKESLSIDNNIVFAYIFGSYGMGKPTPLSDVDIAVYLSSKENIWGKKMELIEKILMN